MDNVLRSPALLEYLSSANLTYSKLWHRGVGYPGPTARIPMALVAGLLHRVGHFLNASFPSANETILLAKATGFIGTVCTPPWQMGSGSIAPHVDGTTTGIAMVWYLSDNVAAARTSSLAGTAFYRDRSTGLDRLTTKAQSRRLVEFKKTLNLSVYPSGSDRHFEELHWEPFKPWRAVAYHMNRLHGVTRLTPEYYGACTPSTGRLAVSLFFRHAQPSSLRLLDADAARLRYGRPFPHAFAGAGEWQR